MAPRAASKRAASSQAAPAFAKKAKGGNPQVEEIQHVLNTKCVSLPEAARNMLVAMVPGSLGVPFDERHENQTAGVAMIVDALETVKTSLTQAIAGEDANVADADNQKGILQKAVDDAKAVLEARCTATAAKKTELDDLTSKRQEQEAVVATAEAAQQEGDASVQAVKAERARVETIVEGDLKAVKEGLWEKEKDAKTHVKQLIPLAKKIGLDESLVAVIPALCMKKPDTWGSFDKIAIQQLEQGLASHLAELASTIDKDSPAVQERAQAVASAQSGLDATKVAEQACVDQVSQAEADEHEAKSLLTQASKAQKAFLPAYKAANKARSSLLSELKQFESELDTAMVLKNHVSARKQRELDAQAMEAQKLAAEQEANESQAEQVPVEEQDL